MVGNIFICLNEATYKGTIPTVLEGSYARKTYDDDGSLVSVLSTTFEEVGEDNKRKFGAVIQLSIEDDNFYVMEFNASWRQSEVSALLALGSGLSYPNNTLLTNEEAIDLIRLNTDDSLS